MSDMQLIEVDLTSGHEFTALIRALSVHAPCSLHILGGVLNSRERTEKFDGADPSKVCAWSSEPLNSIINPSSALFSVLIFSPVSHQFRFFCSAESFPGLPTEEEQAHVVGMMQSLLHLALAEGPKYDSALKPVRALEAPAERKQDERAMIVVGAVHEKWQSCLHTLAAAQNPCVRYVQPPAPSDTPTPSDDFSDKWVVSHIQESDIDTVRATSHIPRSKEYLLSRSAHSVCIRGRDEGGEAQKAVAWALMHTDGSIGTLYVDKEHRRKGFAQVVIKELVRKLDFKKGNGPSSNDDDLGGGALGWNWTEVDVWNDKGRGFFDSFPGWHLGWLCHWTYMNVGSEAT
ncbi:hypothetical protein BV22DRAFT_1130676 [Leucogyrophana mollusca]|uniref:Uncharacterized protein n=1 Tax=Leucogyrophana mollusca TaxID=85980 RepID=A0ACB8BD27_9AGAM|nr:hypothetical protein BV22DRAFT_1130676 [Leucogyrophana mollusca]